MIYKNGSVYFGEFKNSKKHGILHSYSNLNTTTDSTKKTRKTGKYYADKIDDNWDMVGFKSYKKNFVFFVYLVFFEKYLILLCITNIKLNQKILSVKKNNKKDRENTYFSI